MTVLAIDASGLPATAAIVSESKVLAECGVNLKKTHSETLLPMIERLFESAGMPPEDVDYIACASGPGSFTGLRIGASTAKGIAFALGKKIIPVPTLDALACNIFGGTHLTVPVMDARRSQVYAAVYRGMERLAPYAALTLSGLKTLTAEALEREGAALAVFVGDGADVYRRELSEFPFEMAFAPPHLNAQRAATVGTLAVGMESSAVPEEEFTPFYIRLPQAERARLAKAGEHI
ncbi:MAG: tRNA (adenosine(37)-N6)-threonylcarbamoyltransferase complex dimerization subunit type 1 TsaB [Clostridiales bacterium]|jgi:tRNA threonylcarbamoyladenosine biosynthesis protein TsaB|nr:tRNA (adenosine(37)-N6)-threonylcarbamoyltransferase complex dimerization subunit type 1 TsaB [Clostridiales bacterium]